MAKFILNPMFKSISGRLGNVVFYTRRGVQCGRIYVVPRNPDTGHQRKNKNIFREAVQAWQDIPSPQKDRWNRLARNKTLSGYNLFLSCYIKAKRDSEDHACNDIEERQQAGNMYASASYPVRFHSVSGSNTVHNGYNIHPACRLQKGNRPPS